MAAAAAAAGDQGGHGDAAVDEIAQQLDDLNFGPQREPVGPLQKPQIQNIDTEGHRFLYFDLETTGLGPYCHITQIAARSGHEKDNVFSHYVLPKIPIEEEAQRITGISCTGQQMFHHGQPVPSLRITEALKRFITFLEKNPAVLVGHNIRCFDCPILLNALQHCDLVDKFRQAVHRFVDTLPLFKDINNEVENHRLVTLYEHYMKAEFSAHDAKEDVKALQEIVERANPNQGIFSRHSFTFEYVVEFQRYSTEKARYKRPWMDLVQRGVLSKYMAGKAAENHLELSEVRTTFQRDGEEAARRMLKERLIATDTIVDRICEHLCGETPRDP